MSFWQAVHQGGMASELHRGLALGVGGHRGIDATVYIVVTALHKWSLVQRW